MIAAGQQGWFAGLLWTMHKSEAFTRVMAHSALLHEVSLIYQVSSDLFIWQLGRDLGEWLEAHRASWGQGSELVSITFAICFGHFKSDHRDLGVGGIDTASWWEEYKVTLYRGAVGWIVSPLKFRCWRALISDLQPPELWENFLLFKPPRLRCFVVTARADLYKGQSWLIQERVEN